MSMQPAIQPRSSANGFGRRNREMGIRPEIKSQSGKSNPTTKLTNHTGVSSGSKGGVYESPSRDRLVYLTTCLLGHHVDVQLKNGSVFSGIFHATSLDKDFGIVLKMAHLIKEGGSFRGQKANSDSNKAPSKTLIVAAKDLVQISAKGVSVTKDGFAEELRRKKQQEIMIDSSISQSRHAEERELERWVPDEDVPQLPELDNTFDSPWNRNWDQFETNEALFGVKSTFNEEIYTTKLERGPQTREREREATRIANEIEGQETKDIHLAEERGLQLPDSYDIDEETKYSSVFRGVDDSGYEENEDISSDLCNDETFGGSTSDTSRPFDALVSGISSDGAQALPSTSSMDETQSRQSSTVRDVHSSSSIDHATEAASELPCKAPRALDGESRIQQTHSSDQQGGKSTTKEFVEKEMLTEDAQTSKCEESSPDAITHDPSSRASSVVGQEKTSPEVLVSGKSNQPSQTVVSRGRSGSSTSLASDNVGAAPATSGPGLSPSSSMGSLSSEKSTLNPHAKEFKLNPNAKLFVPSQAPVRSPSPVAPPPVANGSFYYPGNMPPVPHMHGGMPMGVGMPPPFAGHQPVMFNPQHVAIQLPQGYYHPNASQYEQQMMLGHPRPVVYMPGYPPEMQYKGREYQ